MTRNGQLSAPSVNLNTFGVWRNFDGRTVAIRIKGIEESAGVPKGLPDRLRNPIVRVDASAPTTSRKYQAYQSWAEYARDLFTFAGPSAGDVMDVLGTRLVDFLAVAAALPEDREVR
ncbi:hypothetical protein ACL02T_15295 [Pseudonocardia sp. RS010]|uniref:hypothetical protein n=1 Tax=Pseudonocardia sp. RS010 TaxID=3385979 RepID=UPI0039A0CF40